MLRIRSRSNPVPLEPLANSEIKEQDLPEAPPHDDVGISM